MRLLTLLLCSVSMVGMVAAESVPFESGVKVAAPSGWNAYMTHSGGVPEWVVIRDRSTPGKPKVLTQLSGDATRHRYPLLVYRDANLKDGSLSVRFKALSGKVDQAAGLVWRFRDADNYYVVRANALENNVVLFKVVNGVRTEIRVRGGEPDAEGGVKQKIATRSWNVLAVSFAGDRIMASFNGETLFDAEDSTFPDPGKVGLWTKADSVIYFRDFQIQKSPAKAVQ